ncbi:MAG: hypothetical protein HY730_02415 [Candidatus Tectomicrobia bacterium]|uniref:Uncharacterized protein n=1 Tax=Tectimicrobiota bacterium TaxID=2528274 RepID=A0A933GKF0_UNCTE|nr:hypothetical protein [Candidatus Tectomicrobia bacterium]
MKQHNPTQLPLELFFVSKPEKVEAKIEVLEETEQPFSEEILAPVPPIDRDEVFESYKTLGQTVKIEVTVQVVHLWGQAV